MAMPSIKTLLSRASISAADDDEYEPENVIPLRTFEQINRDWDRLQKRVRKLEVYRSDLDAAKQQAMAELAEAESQYEAETQAILEEQSVLRAEARPYFEKFALGVSDE